MPTYQYTCTECAHDLEAVQKFTDDALTECPACAGRLRKVFSAVGVVFKGSGFYRTDSRAKASSSTPATGSDKSSGDKGGGDKGGASPEKVASDRAKGASEHVSHVSKDSSAKSSTSSSGSKGGESAA